MFLRRIIGIIAPWILLVIIVILAYWAYDNAIQSARKEGFDAGVSYQKETQKAVDFEEEKRRAHEKDTIERQYRSRIESLLADLNNYRATNDRLHNEIATVRKYLGDATGPQPDSKTTAQIARVLTELYSESVTEYGQVAEEAEKYRLAGEQCELQYDAMRNPHKER
ncbi:lysis protein [Enterobacteria phage 9g]|uniref:Lysis protein n=1 Tax=Enterobacteria phage 9g TaxID=1468411 RepID=X2KTW4_9CAUD|nr:Rz-like spanin [Enterobacteria phage 9g]AHN84561.1 lysis protein [Enterobacteria phage 9g]